MSIGVFQLVKNEAAWVGPWLKRILPYVDEVQIFDGNSTDDTPRIYSMFQAQYKDKLHVEFNRDPKDLKDDYVRHWNECMRRLKTDWAWFLHPDMLVVNPEQIAKVKDMPGVAMRVGMRSIAGEPDGAWFEIKGRASAWKTIYRLRNPHLGAHYFGHYGAQNEDVYFSAITGDEHKHWSENFARYPYDVIDSGIEVLHFSDVRTYERRLDRMIKALMAQGYSGTEAHAIAPTHPRVTLKDGGGFEFVPFDAEPYKKEMEEYLCHA